MGEDLSKLTSGGASTTLAKDHPLMVAWEAFKKSESYGNARKWAGYTEHVDGSMWRCFEVGWQAAKETVPPPVLEVVERVLAERVAMSDGSRKQLSRAIALAIGVSVQKLANELRQPVIAPIVDAADKALREIVWQHSDGKWWIWPKPDVDVTKNVRAILELIEAARGQETAQ